MTENLPATQVFKEFGALLLLDHWAWGWVWSLIPSPYCLGLDSVG